MKRILIAIALVFTVNQAKADWTQQSFKEPAIGCALLGGGAYMAGMDSTTAGLGCVVGAVIGFAVESYYVNKIYDRFEERERTAKVQNEDFIIDRAERLSSPFHPEKEIIWKKTIVPAQRLEDGSFITEHFKLTPTLPGQGMVLGD